MDFGYIFNSQTKMFDAPRFAIDSSFKVSTKRKSGSVSVHPFSVKGSFGREWIVGKEFCGKRCDCVSNFAPAPRFSDCNLQQAVQRHASGMRWLSAEGGVFGASV